MAETLVTLSAHTGAVIAGGAAPGRVNEWPCINFDASSDEGKKYRFAVPLKRNISLDLDVTLVWSANATTGNAVMDVSLQRLEDGVTSVSTDSWSVTSSGTLAAAGTANVIIYDTISFTAAAVASYFIPGEVARMRILRDADNVSDSMSVDFQLQHIILSQPTP